MALTYDVNPPFPPMSPLARLLLGGLIDVDGFAHPSGYRSYGLTPPDATFNLWHTPSENSGFFTVNGSFPVGSIENDSLAVDWTIVNNGVTDSFSTTTTDLTYSFPQGTSIVSGTLHFGAPYGDKSIDVYYYNDVLGSYGIASGPSITVFTPAEPTFTYSLTGTTLSATNTTDPTNISFVSFLWELWEGIPGEGGGTLITTSTDENPTFELTIGIEYSLVLSIVQHIDAVDFNILGGYSSGIVATEATVDFSWSQPSATSKGVYVSPASPILVFASVFLGAIGAGGNSYICYIPQVSAPGLRLSLFALLVDPAIDIEIRVNGANVQTVHIEEYVEEAEFPLFSKVYTVVAQPGWIVGRPAEVSIFVPSTPGTVIIYPQSLLVAEMNFIGTPGVTSRTSFFSMNELFDGFVGGP